MTVADVSVAFTCPRYHAIVALVTLRASRVATAFFAVSTIVLPARATDKAACAAAAEVGQRLFKSHKLVAAREQLLVCSSKDCPDVISQDCTQWLGEVDRSVASVILKPVDETGHRLDNVHVTENGIVIAEHAGEGAVEVDPGAHVFHFERPDYDTAEQRVQLDEGRRNQEIVVTMRPHVATTTPVEQPTHAASSGRTGLLIGAVTMTGLTVVAGALYAGFGLSALADQNTLRTTCAPNCTQDQIAPLNTKFTAANVSLVAGIVTLVAAGVFWIVWGTHAPDKHVSLSGATFTF